MSNECKVAICSWFDNGASYGKISEDINTFWAKEQNRYYENLKSKLPENSQKIFHFQVFTSSKS